METVQTNIETAVVLLQYDEFFLMLERHKTDRTMSGYCLPGGKLEKGEFPKQAAIRELEEETGIKCNQMEAIGEFMGHTGVHHISVYAAKVDSLPIVHISKEHNGYVWVTMSTVELLEALGRLAGRTYKAFEMWKEKY